MKRTYEKPELTFYGSVENYTTGGSGKMSEWKYKSSSSKSTKSSKSDGDDDYHGGWTRNYRKKRSTIKP